MHRNVKTNCPQSLKKNKDNSDQIYLSEYFKAQLTKESLPSF